MGENNTKINKRIKAIETTFDILFLFLLIGFIIEIFFGGLSTLNVLIDVVFLVIYFVAARLAHKKSFAAGVLGLLIGAVEVVIGGLLWKIVGILLCIDSVAFIIELTKTE